MADLASRFSGLNPFSKANRIDDDEDIGEEIDAGTVAGGGHGGRPSEITKSQLRVSHALKSFMVHEGILSEADAGLDSGDQPTKALRSFLEKSHIDVPAHVTDRSHPLPEYFISSSHNTYLLAHQLFGTSCATAYQTALRTGSRCVEIDAWDNSDNMEEPKVTHGYTLVSNIPFRTVCETIRDVVDQEAADAADAQGYRAAPIVLSLENHCEAAGQLRLVRIMYEVLGDRLLSRAVREKGHEEQALGGTHVRLEELGSKVVVIVEYHFPGEVDTSDSDSSSSSEEDDEEERTARRQYKEKKKAAPATVIIPELAGLGVYAQSVKPRDNSWFEDVDASSAGALPHHHLINVSESGLAAHLLTAADKVARHNAHHLMRVFPKGTRVSSRNLKPVPFWSVGAQICALNWQTFGAPMQLNEALFSGTDGYVLKPAALRPLTTTTPTPTTTMKKRRRLRLRVAGATDVPIPHDRDGDDEVRPYLTCTLLQGSTETKRKTSAYRRHKLGFLHRGENPPPTDPVWDEALEWEYDDDELVFLRLLVKSDDSFARNPLLAVAAVRLLYVVPGWSFVRMLDLRGHETRCALLVKFEIQDV